MNRKGVAGVLALGVTTGVAAWQTAPGRRFVRRRARAVTREVRYRSGRLAGLRYRMAGRHPDPAVGDRVLADRVRSMLGRLERRLDIPHVHVQVDGHEALLHGDVVSEAQAEAVVDAVRLVPGVQEVVSRLHVGLSPGDTRPSNGSAHPGPSKALAGVIAAAQRGGAPEGHERACARSVLSTFAAVLPAGERRHVLAHLPSDLRTLAEPLRPKWADHRHLRRLEQFSLAALPNVAPEHRQSIVESVVGALKTLVPEEGVDVAAVLPLDLRRLWMAPVGSDSPISGRRQDLRP